MQAHEEKSFIESGLRKKERRIENQEKYWKEGWIEEVEGKISSRNIEILNEGKKIEFKTKNKLIMEHAKECVEIIKVKKEMLIKLIPREITKVCIYHMRY